MGRYGRNLGWSLLLLASFAKAAEKEKPKASEKDKITEIAWGDLRLLNLTTKLDPFNMKSQYGEPAVTIFAAHISPYKK